MKRLSTTQRIAKAVARAGKGLLKFYCKLEAKSTPMYQLLKKGGKIVTSNAKGSK